MDGYFLMVGGGLTLPVEALHRTILLVNTPPFPQRGSMWASDVRLPAATPPSPRERNPLPSPSPETTTTITHPTRPVTAIFHDCEAHEGSRVIEGGGGSGSLSPSPAGYHHPHCCRCPCFHHHDRQNRPPLSPTMDRPPTPTPAVRPPGYSAIASTCSRQQHQLCRRHRP
jgi:hypothetical protein